MEKYVHSIHIPSIYVTYTRINFSFRPEQNNSNEMCYSKNYDIVHPYFIYVTNCLEVPDKR